MASIKAKLSSVELYTSQCGDDYSMILNIANDVLSRAEKLYIIVQEELEKISRQLNRVQRSYDDIQHKVTSYMQRMEDAAEEIDRCSEEISYIYSHPSTVTTTDDEGNETTEEVIDYDGIRAAERERDAARSTYNLYENKCDDARMVLREAGYTVSKFQNTKYGIEAVSRSIQNDIYEIKKYIRAIEDEAEFNIHSLQGVIDSLQSYLASKAIFMPEGSYYEEFAAASVGGSSAIKASTSSVEGGNSNNNGAGVGKKIVSGVKTAIGVAAAAIASVVPSPADAPQQQYIDATPKTEIARSIDHYNSGNPKQERLNQDYLELQERRKKEEGEVIPSADVPAGAGGDVPKSDVSYRFIENEDGIPIGIEIFTNGNESAYQTSNGLSVTYLSSSSDSKNGKKYTDGVVIEGQLTFTYDHQKHTVSLNRKVHQYAAGIDLNYKRSNGQTNYEAMLEGKSPIVLIQTPDGVKKTRLDLHHLTQQEVIGFPDAPYSQGTLAEVPVASHQKYTKVIHMRYPREKGINTSFRVDKLPNHKYKPSKDEAQFNEFRKQYWKARAQMLKEFNR